MRYAEMGLKGPPVRKRFESILVNNIMDALAREGVECLVTTEHGRIFLEVGDMARAVDTLSRVFGVSSVSPTRMCGSDMEEIKHTAVEVAKEVLVPGMRFAVRARREGTHPYTSMDIGREVGSAIYLAVNGLEVDLSSPEAEVFVEVRNNRAYVFTESVPGPGGLPMGSQGKVLAVIDSDRDALAAWMMMKRGARVIAVSDSPVTLLDRWCPSLRVDSGDLDHLVWKLEALGVVHGHTIDHIEDIKAAVRDVPTYFPLVGMNEKEIERGLRVLRD